MFLRNLEKKMEYQEIDLKIFMKGKPIQKRALYRIVFIFSNYGKFFRTFEISDIL